MNFALQRMKEPSTWASILGLVAIFKPDLAPQLGAMAAAVPAAIGVLGVLLPEQGKKP